MKYRFVKENTTEAGSGTLPTITKESLDSLPAEVAKGYLDNKVIEVPDGDVETITTELEAQIRETPEKVYTESELLKMRKAALVVLAESKGIQVVPDEESIPDIAKKILEKQNGGSN